MNVEYFNKIYLEEIDGIKNNILTIRNEIEKDSYRYKFNLNKFDGVPCIYNDVSIFYSALNEDPNHVLNQLNKRTSKNYTHNDILIIVKRFIDFYIKNKKGYKFNFNQTFTVKSKSYLDFKVPVQITENHIDGFDKITLSKTYGKIFDSKYFCFIYTILEPWMISKNHCDKTVEVEEKEIMKEFIVE